MPTKLYVGNIPASVNSRSLTELFEKYGKVLECDIIKDFAFVHMEDSSKAKASIAALNDFNLNGNRIRVEMSVTQARQPSRPSRRDDLSPPPRHHSSSISSSRRDYPTISSSRNGGYSSSGGSGGGPDRSYPNIRHSYLENRSRPYESSYDRHKVSSSASMHYPDSYSLRNRPPSPYSRDDYYHHRPSSMSSSEPYGRAPSFRSNYDPYPSYSTSSRSFGSSRSRYPTSPGSSRHDSGRYASSPGRRTSKRSPPPSPPLHSSRSRR